MPVDVHTRKNLQEQVDENPFLELYEPKNPKNSEEKENNDRESRRKKTEE